MEWLQEVTDPEIPVLNIVEMGIARSVSMDGGKVTIKITPTYSGCPAMAAIEQDIRLKMAEKGIEQIEVKKDFSEVWTTDWMSDEAKAKLEEYGIAPPRKSKKFTVLIVIPQIQNYEVNLALLRARLCITATIVRSLLNILSVYRPRIITDLAVFLIGPLE